MSYDTANTSRDTSPKYCLDILITLFNLKYLDVEYMPSAKIFGLKFCFKFIWQILENHMSTAFLNVLWALIICSTPGKPVDSVLHTQVLKHFAWHLFPFNMHV